MCAAVCVAVCVAVCAVGCVATWPQTACHRRFRCVVGRVVSRAVSRAVGRVAVRYSSAAVRSGRRPGPSRADNRRRAQSAVAAGHGAHKRPLFAATDGRGGQWPLVAASGPGLFGGAGSLGVVGTDTTRARKD